MDNSNILESQVRDKAPRRARRSMEADDPGKKPKKVNSEIRKQQNRIASRNYREKRKRKLQYLQQLIKEGSNDDETPEPSPQQAEAHLRAPSTEYEAAGPSSSPFILSSNNDFPSPSPSTASGLGPAAATVVPALENRYISSTPMYPAFENSWSQPAYDSNLSQQMLWNAPAWIPQLDYSSRMVSHPDAYQYAPPTGPPVFAQATESYFLQQNMVNSPPYTDSSSYGQYYGPQSQTSSISSVSLPTSTSHFQGHRPGPH